MARRGRRASSERDVDVTEYFRPLVRTLADGTTEEVPREITARGLILEAVDAWRPFAEERFAQAQLNERYIAGDQQWGRKDGQRGPSELVVEWPKWLPKTTRNLMGNLHLTNVARVTRGDPSVKAWGADSSAGDVAQATIANQLLYSLRTNQDHRKKISRAAATAAAQGTVFFYVYWNVDAGPLGADGAPLGDIEVEPLQIFDWMTDGSEELEQSKYLCIRRWLDKDEAHELLLGAGVEDEPKTEALRNIRGDTGQQRVEAFHYWQPPTPQCPRGLFIVQVCGHIVDVRDFPYAHNEIPGAVWKWNDLTDSPFGRTPADDAVQLQSHLNRLHASLAFITAKSAKWLKGIGHKKITDKFNGDAQLIDCDDPQAINAFRIVGAPPPPALLYTQIEEAERMLREVYGVSEAVVGSDASASKNARHLQYMSELDAQKLSATVVARDHALLRVYRQALKLWAQFVKAERTTLVLGADKGPQIVRWSGADIIGVDVYLEPASGADQGKAAQALDAEQGAAQGWMPPARGAELRETGQAMTRLEAMGRRIVQRQIADVGRGFAAEVDPSVPAEVAVEELTLALETLDPMTPAYAALSALAQAYAQQAAPVEGTPKAPPPEPESIA